MLYHHGSLQEALKNFKVSLSSRQRHRWILLVPQSSVTNLEGGLLRRWSSSPDPCATNSAICPKSQRCLQLEPYNEVCQYMKGLSHVAMGQFYEGIKAQTKVMLNDPLPGQKASPEYLRVKYLRGKQTVLGVFMTVLSAVGVLLLLGGGRIGVGILSLVSLAAGGFGTRVLSVFRNRPDVLSTLSTGLVKLRKAWPE